MYVLLAYLLGILTATRNKNQINTVSNTSTTNERSKCPQNPVVAEVHFSEREEGNRKTYEQQQIRLQRLLMIATWLTFISASIYAGITLGQWQQMKKATQLTARAAQAAQESANAANKSAELAEIALKESDKSFRVSERPYMTVSMIRNDSPINSSGQIKFVIQLINSGKTPAVKVEITNNGFLDGVKMGKDPKVESRAIVQSGGVDGVDSIATFSEETVTRIKAKKSVFSIRGTAKYTDIFKDQH